MKKLSDKAQNRMLMILAAGSMILAVHFFMKAIISM